MLGYRGNQVCNSKSFSANFREVLVIWVQFTKNVQRIQELFWLSFLQIVVSLLAQEKIVRYGNKATASRSKKKHEYAMGLSAEEIKNILVQYDCYYEERLSDLNLW